MNTSVRVPVEPDGKTWNKTIEFLFEVKKSSTHPKVFTIAIEAKGCENTVKTKSVPMRTKALEMPKITLDPLERMIFQEKVVTLQLHLMHSHQSVFLTACR